MTSCIFLIDFTNFDKKSIEALEMLIWLWTPKLSIMMITTHIGSKLKHFDITHICDQLKRERMENVLMCENLHNIW